MRPQKARKVRISSDSVFFSPSVLGYPVHVFIHGGALVEGSSSFYEASGVTMALEGGIITVTLNYRLNIFGYFKPSSISNGHFGFRDQQLALKWVKQNIAAFGGDPHCVTLAGQSAGAVFSRIYLLIFFYLKDSFHAFVRC